MKKISMKYKFIITNLILFFCAFTVPVLIFGGILLYNSSSRTSQDFQEKINNTLSLAEENLDTVMSEIRTLNLYLENSNQIMYFYQLLSNKTIDYPSSILLKYLGAFMTSLKDTKIYIDSIYIYIENNLNRVITSDVMIADIDKLKDKEWKSEITNGNPGKRWVKSRSIKKYDFEDQYSVLTVYSKFQQYNGGIVVNYNQNYIDELLQAMTFYDEQSLVAVNEENDILFYNTNFNQNLRQLVTEKNWEDADLLEISYHGSKYFAKVMKYTPYSIKLITLIPKDVLYSTTAENAKSTIILIALITIITIMLSYSIAIKNYKQLHGILEIFDKAQRNLELPNITQKYKDLYGYILNNIIRTFVEKSFLQIQLSERKYKLKSAELLALQYQINPHFLFNTLQTINYEILSLSKGTSTEANKMVEYLSDILRFSLESSKVEVTLEKEIENCKKYIEIQKIRYSNHFTVDWNIENNLLQKNVRRLILQPLVENSIQHGIKDKVEEGKIKITIKSMNNCIRLTIVDNGIGIKKDKLDIIKNELVQFSPEFNAEHIGIINCNQRLVLAYSEKSMLHMWSKEGLSTIIYFDIPLIELSDNNDN